MSLDLTSVANTAIKAYIAYYAITIAAAAIFTVALYLIKNFENSPNNDLKFSKATPHQANYHEHSH